MAGGVGVIIDTNGHLGTVVSSERFKDEINPMNKASEAILALKPKEHRNVEEQQTTIGELKSAVAQHEKLKTTIAQQQKQIKALTAIVQKVSDQLAFNNLGPQSVANP